MGENWVSCLPPLVRGGIQNLDIILRPHLVITKICAIYAEWGKSLNQ
jgi:hypothetical protein